jgi:hypothetical protein
MGTVVKAQPDPIPNCKRDSTMTGVVLMLSNLLCLFQA